MVSVTVVITVLHGGIVVVVVGKVVVMVVVGVGIGVVVEVVVIRIVVGTGVVDHTTMSLHLLAHPLKQQ